MVDVVDVVVVLCDVLRLEKGIVKGCCDFEMGKLYFHTLQCS